MPIGRVSAATTGSRLGACGVRPSPTDHATCPAPWLSRCNPVRFRAWVGNSEGNPRFRWFDHRLTPQRRGLVPMANRKIIAGAAMAGALAVGGAFGVALGTPGVSGGQQVSAVINPAAATTTVPNGAKPTMPGGPGGPGGFHRGPGPGPGDGAQFEAAAKAIGISVDDLRKELASGKSIADV